MHVHRQIFQGHLLKKIRPIILIVWMLGRVEKRLKKGKKKKNVLFVFHKCQSITSVSTLIFQGSF